MDRRNEILDFIPRGGAHEGIGPKARRRIRLSIEILSPLYNNKVTVVVPEMPWPS
jgi:hypothetical protein